MLDNGIHRRGKLKRTKEVSGKKLSEMEETKKKKEGGTLTSLRTNGEVVG